MIAGRPDWCISRQRSWGVPLPFFLHKDTGELHPRTMEILDQAADMVEQGGIEAWSKVSADDILGAADAEHYTKSTDILEVWFDSGTTHTTCCSHSHAGAVTRWPEADLYLEGHDQHRGWFHSSLLTACAMYDRAPYKGLLTHGFTVDGQGRKMSKSEGNGVDPQAVSGKLGAEIIRLWVRRDRLLGRHRRSTTRSWRAWSTPTAASATRCASCWPTSATSTRRRTPCRSTQMLEIDRYALSRAAQLQADILAHYEVYEFHPVVAKLQIYCSEDLGAFYLDILKDRLYTTGAQVAGPAQRADRAVRRSPRRCCAGWRRS